LQVGAGILASVRHPFHSNGTELPLNLGSKIYFVIRRPDTRAQLYDKVGGIRPELLGHLANRCAGDIQLRTFSSRVDQTNCRSLCIHEEDGAAIGDVNT
jgi:hypothetical protein